MATTRKHATRAAIVVAALATTALTVSAAPASAGSNGQHVQVCTGKYLPRSAVVMGTDQNGRYAQTPRTALAPGSLKCAAFPQYWFKGNVTVRWYNQDNSYSDQYAYVPVSQSFGDWYGINN
jgi:hypothetical protein